VDRYRNVQFQGTKAAGKKAIRGPQTRAPIGNTTMCASTSFAALLHLFGVRCRSVSRIDHETRRRQRDWRWVGYDNAWINLNGRRVNRSLAARMGRRHVDQQPGPGAGRTVMLDDGKANGRQVFQQNGSSACAHRARSRRSTAI